MFKVTLQVATGAESAVYVYGDLLT